MTTHNHDEIHNYEGLLPTSPSSNKRSLTNHLADYVKKTKYVAPHATQPPTDEPCVSSLQRESRSAASKVPAKKPIEQASKRGSLCIAYSISDDHQADNSILNIHVLRAKQLVLANVESTKHASPLNTFVKVTYPHQFEQCSKIIHGTDSPVYDETFSIPYNNKSLSTPSKRLTIAVYNQAISNKKSDLIGCMSFNMKTLLKTTGCTKTSSKYKWYCLLPESIGRHKRMALNVDVSSSNCKKILAAAKRSHSSQQNHQSNGWVYNVDIHDRDEIHFASGFPCAVSEVKSSVGSTCTRPMAGDLLLQVNNINVSRTQVKAIKKLIRSLSLPITLQLYRRSAPSASIKLDKIILNSVDQHQPLNTNFVASKNIHADRLLPSSDKQYKNHSDRLLPESILINLEPAAQQQSLLLSPIHRKIVEQSDESESGVGSESNPYSDGDQENRLKVLSESYEREALHLIEIEKEFIRQIELGVQLYSRPLKHFLISSNEHARLFQNIEKILAISRYQLNRLQSLSERTIVCHIGKIFHEKVQLICEAFTRYISGSADASAQLKQLSKCASFQRFIQNGNHKLSIEQFLQIPLNHIDNLAHQLDILCCTCESANDANYLLHVLKELRQCSLHVSSIESSTSHNHCTTTMSLNSASGTSSWMHHAEDNDIVELQNRLHFTKNIKPVVLTGRNRHVILSGALLLQNENKTYIETWAVLLNDMLLLTQRNPTDARLTLVCDAISLHDIVDFRSSDERQDALIFLSTKPNMPYKIRYSSKSLQYAWQTILEQRLKTWQRSIHDDSSSADSDLE